LGETDGDSTIASVAVLKSSALILCKHYLPIARNVRIAGGLAIIGRPAATAESGHEQHQGHCSDSIPHKGSHQVAYS
jgi:hypothetical protein